jgi:rod shape determining protein RodA
MFDKKTIRNFDFPILIIIFFIVGYSLVAIGNATADPFTGEEQGIMQIINNLNLKYVKLQLLWFALGLVLMGITIWIDYSTIGELTNYIYWANVALLLIVLVLGHTAKGSQAWFRLGNRGFQPSEIAKISIIITMAKLLGSKEGSITSLWELMPIFFHFSIPFVLILLQPDFGTAMVYIVILFGMLFVAGLSYKLLFGFIGAGLASLPLLWFFVLEDFQKNRILTFFDPSRDPMGAGYNVLQSMIAIGSGQLFGKGLLKEGAMSQLDFIPEKHTDFIFSVTAEALGFVGAALLVVLYALLIFRTLSLARKAKDKFGSLIIMGVLSMVMFHIFENIGMSMGMMPVTGIPLPFMSYGGSSMFTNMISFGLVLNVGLRRQKIKF